MKIFHHFILFYFFTLDIAYTCSSQSQWEPRGNHSARDSCRKPSSAPCIRGGLAPTSKFSEKVAVHKARLLFHSRGSRIVLTRSQLSQWCMCCVRDCTLWQAAQSLLISMRQAQRKKMGGSIAKREARRKRQCNIRLEGERELMKSTWSIHYSCYRS